MTQQQPLTVYKASAGSGKTYTLAYEYIKMLLGVKDHTGGHYRLNPGSGARESMRHRFILAITFTNAATNEMKQRIVKELSLLAAGSPKAEYTARLALEFGCTAEELRVSARTALSELLYDYSAFNVSTIDSFFQNVLRTFWHELQRQGDYVLALDSDEMLSGSLSEMLDTYNYRPEQTDTAMRLWIRNFMTNNMLEGNTYNLFDRGGSVLKQLAGVVDKSMDERFLTASAAIRSYLEDSSRAERFTRKVKQLRESLLDESVKAARAFGDFLTASNASLKSADGATAWVSDWYAPERRFAPSVPAVFKAACEGADFIPKLFKAATIRTLPPDIIEHGAGLFRNHALLARRRKHADTLLRLVKAMQNLQFLGFATGFLESYLRDKNTMLIGESGQLLKDLIAGGEVPFIYERIGTQLRHLLIDEFQDTSRTQWDNLRPLVRNSIDDRNECLIIGDVKQSIYRFRNSDSTLLGTEVENGDFPGLVTPRGHSAQENTNHRSAHGIVRFNNTVFSRMAAELGIPGYENVAQTPWPRLAAQDSFVKVCFWNKKSQEDVFEHVAADMLRQHRSGWRWRDILVLVHRHKHALAFIQYMTARHPEIPLLSSQSLLLRNSRAVRSIMALLKMVAGSYGAEIAPENPEQAPLYGTNRDIELMRSRFEFYAGGSGDYQAALDAALDDGSARRDIEKEIDAIRRENSTNLVAMIEAIVYHCLAEADGDGNTRRCGVYADEQAFIAALQDRAVEHIQGPDPSVQAFVEQWELKGDQWAIQASASTDAVEIMTIHASKGLERKCVHIPLLNCPLTKDEEMWLPAGDIFPDCPEDCPPLLRVEVQPDDFLLDSRFGSLARAAQAGFTAMKADSFNTVYVALTRARRELCIHSMPGGAPGIKPETYMEMYLENALQAPFTEKDTNLFTDTAAGARHMTVPEGEDAPAIPQPERMYSFGAPTTPEAADLGNNAEQPVDYCVSMRPDLKKFTSVRDILAVDDEDDADACPEADIVDDDRTTAAMREAAADGMNMHAILENMRHAGDLYESVRRLTLRRSLDPATAARYYRLLEQAFADGGELVASWFSPQATVFAERALFDPRTGLTKRPDRVVRLQDGSLVVIDYKFTTEVKPEHVRQLHHYLGLVEEVDGTRPRGFLWYPGLNKIKEVN